MACISIQEDNQDKDQQRTWLLICKYHKKIHSLNLGADYDEKVQTRPSCCPAYIYIYIYIDKIVLNKTKYLTLNSGAMGHKNTSI